MDEQLIMLRTGHRSATGVRSYKRTTSTQTSSVLNDCTNVNVTNIDADESLPKKDKEAGTIVDSKAISKAGHFSCSSSITLNFHEFVSFHFTLSRNLYILYVKCH